MLKTVDDYISETVAMGLYDIKDTFSDSDQYIRFPCKSTNLKVPFVYGYKTEVD